MQLRLAQALQIAFATVLVDIVALAACDRSAACPSGNMQTVREVEDLTFVHVFAETLGHETDSALRNAAVVTKNQHDSPGISKALDTQSFSR